MPGNIKVECYSVSLHALRETNLTGKASQETVKYTVSVCSLTTCITTLKPKGYWIGIEIL